MSKVVCDYTVVRYVPDPVRDEAKNIGVIVVADDLKWAAGKFQIPGYLRRNETQAAFLDSLIERFKGSLAHIEPDFNRQELETLHREGSGVIQYRKPASALAEDPEHLLGDLYKRLVFHAQPAPARITRSKVISRLDRTFRARGVTATIEPKPKFHFPGGGDVQFDIGLSNGSLKHVMEVISFNRAEVDSSEHTGAWFAQVWPEVQKTAKANAHLVLEPGEGTDVQQRVRRVGNWAKEAGIRVVDSTRTDQLDSWAAELAEDFLPAGTRRH